MASEDTVSKLYEFLYERYNSELQRAANNESALAIDFNDFDRYDPITADMLLEAPNEVLDGFAEAAKRIVPEADVNIRIRAIPERRMVRIRNLRSKHMDKLWCIDAVVKSATEVKPQIYEVVFQCPECDTKMSMKQDSNIVQKPAICGPPYTESGCGRRGDFNVIAKKMFDVRWLTGVEPFEVTEGDQPGEIAIFLKEDLTTPRMQKRTDPGNRLKIVGILKEVPKRIKGKLSTKMDMMMEALHVEFSEMEFDDVEITKEDEMMIKAMAADPKIYEKLVASIAPGIYGFAEIKEAIALQLFGGVAHKLPDGSHIRGNIHILLTGDPGVGKSIMLKFVSDIMPRGRYVSGSGATGAGLTASVRKDEIMGGWLLEAGALILTNKSVISIDEFDKMGKDDQIAMHEAMSVESYHGDTEITLATGEHIKIRDLVERMLEENSSRIKKGDDCLFAEVNGPEILVTDFVDIKKARTFRVSKHAAPEHFYRIILENGREVTVTPRHPFFVFNGKTFITRPSEQLQSGEFVPIPKCLPIEGEEQKVIVKLSKNNHYNAKHINIPNHNSPEMCKFLGYLISEGSHEVNRGKNCGISFTNSNELLLKDFESITQNLFGLAPYVHKKKGRTMLRYVSMELADYINSIEPRLLMNSYKKKIPALFMKCKKADIAIMLRALFDGDGGICQGSGFYIVYTTASKDLGIQISDLLLRFGITTSIRKSRSVHDIYRIIITGEENLRKFESSIGFSDAAKNQKILEYAGNRTLRRHYSETLPLGNTMRTLLRSLGLSEKTVFGYTLTEYGEKFAFTTDKISRIIPLLEKRLEELKLAKRRLSDFANTEDLKSLRKHFGISLFQIAEKTGRSHQSISLWERGETCPEFVESYRKALLQIIDGIITNERDVHMLKNIAHGEVALCRIKKIEKIRDQTEEWSYDISVPGEVFVSHGMVLHNTISIAKASIVATLPAQTAVLAGANPKLGRFDPYMPIVDQIQISETLLSRFDLKFALRDKPDRNLDERLAEHITMSRITPEVVEPVIDAHTLRKYIAYAKQKITSVVLSKDAADTLKKFYVEMRNPGDNENNTVSITLRQYEALLRLAEASAKVRLDNKVLPEDAERSIRLMKYSLSQLGYDYDTGKFDIDMMESGVTSNKRRKIVIITDIISTFDKRGGEISIEDLKAAAEEQGVENADEIIERLKSQGTLFEPRPGFIKKT
ncbi:MAG: hypothetical protein HY364_05510 [Candidatus Aenigmarchaeota archaeon]|nr:hypothetical protein [Candidatus Aenigmarchaeota archaeon]